MAAQAALLLGRKFVIRNVTSRPLGSLAAGYAATPTGYTSYTFLVGDIGLVLVALYFAVPWLILLAVALFVIGSVVVIAGEVVTYRALKR